MIKNNLYDKITSGEFAEQLIAMLDAGVPVEAIVRVITFGGFMQGKYTPDVGFMIVEPLMKLVSAIGIRAGVKELRLSLNDLSNDKFLKDMAELKAASNEAASSGVEVPYATTVKPIIILLIRSFFARETYEPNK